MIVADNICCMMKHSGIDSDCTLRIDSEIINVKIKQRSHLLMIADTFLTFISADHLHSSSRRSFIMPPLTDPSNSEPRKRIPSKELWICVTQISYYGHFAVFVKTQTFWCEFFLYGWELWIPEHKGQEVDEESISHWRILRIRKDGKFRWQSSSRGRALHEDSELERNVAILGTQIIAYSRNGGKNSRRIW